jgi:hypothetical protein
MVWLYWGLLEMILRLLEMILIFGLMYIAFFSEHTLNSAVFFGFTLCCLIASCYFDFTLIGIDKAVSEQRKQEAEKLFYSNPKVLLEKYWR